MRAPLNMQSWALGICVKRARDIAKLERMSEKEADHFVSVLRKASETTDAMAPHADAIRDLVKRGRE